MKLFIGCGSSDDVPSIYLEESRELLKLLLKDNELLYGAYNQGIMGIAYEVAKENGCKITGYAPKEYKDELEKLDIDEKIVVENIEHRTNELVTKSDAIIFLPGGIGTMNEIFSAIDVKRCGELDKPIIIYNIDHYYDKLIDFLEKLYNENFSPINVKDTYYITDRKENVLKYLNIKEN